MKSLINRQQNQTFTPENVFTNLFTKHYYLLLISTVAYTTQREDCDAARVRKKAMS